MDYLTKLVLLFLLCYISSSLLSPLVSSPFDHLFLLSSPLLFSPFLSSPLLSSTLLSSPLLSFSSDYRQREGLVTLLIIL